MVEVPHPTRRKNEGKNLGSKYLELSGRRRAFAREKHGENVVSFFLPDGVFLPCDHRLCY